MIETVALNHRATAIFLNRPAKRNALSSQLLKALGDTLKSFESRESIRTLFILGKGEDFCTGLDLAEAIDPKKIATSAQLLEEVFRTLFKMPQVTIACVSGRAFGGGGGIALATDFLLMEEGSQLGFPEVNRGLIPAFVSVIIKRKVNEQLLKRLLLLSEPLLAKDAVSEEVALKSVKKGMLLMEAEKIAEKVILAAPNAIKETKALLNALYDVEKGFSLAAEYHEKARHSKEAEEGIAAFLEKRLPLWI